MTAEVICFKHYLFIIYITMCVCVWYSGSHKTMKNENKAVYCFSNRGDVPQAYFYHPSIGYQMYRYD